jgi:acyl-coenzyme A thioesterase PaaI-like protein
MSEELAQPAPGEVPEDFVLMPKVGGFSDEMGPLYLRDGEHGKDVGAWILERHCNPVGVAHGGWLMALMDHVLAGAAVSHLDIAHGGVTVNASFDFLRGARRGEWCESQVTLKRPTSTLCFIEARLLGAAGVVVRCNGIAMYPRR